MGPRADLYGCGKSQSHRDSIPGPSRPERVAILTELTWPHFSKYFGFRLPVTFHYCCILIFIYTLFVTETWEFKKKRAFSEIDENWMEKNFHCF